MRKFRRKWADAVPETPRWWREIDINCSTSGFRRALTYPWVPKPQLFRPSVREPGDVWHSIGFKRRATKIRYFGSGGGVRL